MMTTSLEYPEFEKHQTKKVIIDSNPVQIDPHSNDEIQRACLIDLIMILKSLPIAKRILISSLISLLIH